MGDTEQIAKLEAALERANADYLRLLQSEEYCMGRRLAKLKKLANERHFATILKDLTRRNAVKSVDNATRRTEVAAPTGAFVPIERDENICIYSCVTNGYDRVADPYYEPQAYEGILFSDMVSESEFWRHCDLDFSNPELAKNPNRYIKLHPFDFDGTYDYAIYIDGSVVLVSDVSQFAEVAKASPSGFAIHGHPLRDCLYDEGSFCIAAGRGNAEQIKTQLARYESEGMPHHFGLFEATVFAVDLHSDIACTIFENWWAELCRSDSGRDQLALPYVLWKMGLTSSDIGILGPDVSVNPKLRVLKHNVNAWQISAVSDCGSAMGGNN